MAVYATGDDLITCYDVDMVGDLAQDNRETEPTDGVPTLPVVIAFLEQASGAVETALLAGGKYLIPQLQALTGSDRAFLVRVVCTVAMAMLFERRPQTAYLEVGKMLCDKADGYLKALRAGENLFNIPANIDASVIDAQSMSAVEVQDLNLLPHRMYGYFPSASTRLPRRF